MTPLAFIPWSALGLKGRIGLCVPQSCSPQRASNLATLKTLREWNSRRHSASVYTQTPGFGPCSCSATVCTGPALFASSWISSQLVFFVRQEMHSVQTGPSESSPSELSRLVFVAKLKATRLRRPTRSREYSRYHVMMLGSLLLFYCTASQNSAT